MKKAALTTSLMVMAIAATLLNGCDDEYCPGFEAEPYFSIYTDSVGVKIYSSNDEVGDTIDLLAGAYTRLPFDMNASQMTYEVYAPEYRGSLILDYNLNSQECKYDKTFLLVFDQLRVNESSTFTELYATEYYSNREQGTRIDSVENLSGYFTPYLYEIGSQWQLRL